MSTREEKIRLLILLNEKERRQCERSYYEFFQRAWSVLEPTTPLKNNWHIEYLCNRLQQEVERIANKQPKTKDIIINICPRSLKSYIVSIMLAPWAWTRFPQLKFIGTSYAESLSIEHCRKSRQLIESEWYQGHWGGVYSLTGDQNVKSFYENNRYGMRFATSVGGSVTGHGGDIVIVDDPLNPNDVASKIQLEKTNKYFNDVLYTRLNDQEIGVRVVVMQRLDVEDLTGHLLKKNKDDYEHICIPAELQTGRTHPSPIELEQHYSDGMFFPNRFSRAVLDKMKKNPRSYSGQMLQSPCELGGNLLKRSYWKFYKELPPKFDVMVQSWDMAFKGLNTSDYVVGQVWGRLGLDNYLVAQVRKQMGIKDTIKSLLMLSAGYPLARKKYVEDKANGPAVMELLTNEVAGLFPVEPVGGKYARANAVVYLIESGHVLIPHPDICPWTEEFIEECAQFKENASQDDQVDAMTQALAKIGISMSPAERLRKLLG